MPSNAQIASRFKEFGQARFGTAWGWMTRYAEALEMDPGALRNYLVGDRVPGNKMQAKLRELGCDLKWLMTGEKEEKPTLSADDQQMLELLRDRGIRTAADLDQCISDREKLKRALGPVAYQTFVETAVAVGEKQARFRGKRKRT